MTVFGWDASDFDWARGPVDLAAARRDGIDFLTHKATEGTQWRHTRYGEALRRARDAGIPLLGAYVVPRTPGNGGNGSIAAQTDYFLSYVNAQTPWWRSFPGWFWQVDLEKWSSNGVVYDAVAPAYGVEMGRRLREATGKRVILYAPGWAYGNSIPNDGTPLWESDYGTNPTVHYRQAYPGDGSARWAPYSGRTPAILQFGSRTTIGSQPICDANAFRGTLDQLKALLTGDDMTTLDDTHKGPDGNPRSYAKMVADLHDHTFWGTYAAGFPKSIQARLAVLEAKPPVQSAPVDPATLKAVLLDPEVLAAQAKANADENARRQAD